MGERRVERRGREENFVIEQGTLCDVFAQAFAAGEHSIDS